MEMKNICGKIPVDLHEKMKLEIEELGISIPKYLEMVIEEHMTRKGEKTNMADLRTVAVQVTEDLFSRLKAVLAMKQKDFLIGLIEEAIEKEEAKWKAESEEAEETEGEPAESEMEDPETAESEPDEESAEPEAEEPETEALEAETDGEMTEPDEAEAYEEPTEPENEEPAELETGETESEAIDSKDAEE